MCFGASCCEILKTFYGCRYEWYLSNELLHVAFGFPVDELEGFLNFSPSSSMLSATIHVAESAQVGHFKGGQGGAAVLEREGDGVNIVPSKIATMH